MLQDHHLGDPIPLAPDAIELPSGCTLFKPVQTHVYYPRDSDIVLDKKARFQLKKISEKISVQKKFIVKDTWEQWITTVLDQINAHEELQNLLYTHQSEFFMENVYHRNISDKEIRSNKIKKYLHEILTNAIFENYPCKDLLLMMKKQPSKEDWSEDEVFWLSLKADPYPIVSVHSCNLFLHLLSHILIFF